MGSGDRMVLVFNLIFWLGTALLMAFLLLSTYRIFTGRSLLPSMAVEKERELAPIAVVLIFGLLTIGYFGLSFVQGSFL